jgi:hypothetical protein
MATPPDNALTRRLLQSTGIPTFPQPSFGPTMRQKGRRPDPIFTINPSGGREWRQETHNHISDSGPSRLPVSELPDPVGPSANARGTWTGERYTTTLGFRLPFRWSQDRQLVCFVSRKNSPRCCNYLFPHCPTVSKSCERSGSGGGLATSAKPRGFALATEL